MSEINEINYGTPGMLSLMREAFGVAPLKQSEAVGDVFVVGTSAVGSLGDKVWEGLTRRDPTTGTGEAALSYGYDVAKGWVKRQLFSSRGGLV